MRVTLRLVFGDQEQQVYVAETTPVNVGEPESESLRMPPYRFPIWTAPVEPTLIQSGSFVRFE